MNISYFYTRKLIEVMIFEHIYFLYLARKLLLILLFWDFFNFVSFVSSEILWQSNF